MQTAHLVWQRASLGHLKFGATQLRGPNVWRGQRCSEHEAHPAYCHPAYSQLPIANCLLPRFMLGHLVCQRLQIVQLPLRSCLCYRRKHLRGSFIRMLALVGGTPAFHIRFSHAHTVRLGEPRFSAGARCRVKLPSRQRPGSLLTMLPRCDRRISRGKAGKLVAVAGFVRSPAAWHQHPSSFEPLEPMGTPNLWPARRSAHNTMRLRGSAGKSNDCEFRMYEI